MIKKMWIGLGLLAATALSGCIVVPPPPPGIAFRSGYDCGYGYRDEVVVQPFFPVFGFWGGGYHEGYRGEHGGGRGYHHR